MTYIVMNNGCYGLTKGQDSATADFGSINKTGKANEFGPIDLAGLALELGASFVARSFSGDKTQLVPLIKAAMSHPGFAFIDVISPCVTFNNNVGSTKSYDFVRDHIEATSTVDFVPHRDEITIQYEAGNQMDVELHDGSFLRLDKLAPNWDPFDRNSATNRLQESRQKGDVLTGLLYIDPKTADLHKKLNTVDVPLNTLGPDKLCPGQAALDKINESFRG